MADLSAIVAVPAFLSIILTVYSMHMQKRHNSMSFRPVVVIGVRDYVNEKEVSLRNVGNGPLKIQKLRVYKNNSDKEYKSIIGALNDNNINTLWSTFVGCIDGRYVAAGEKIILLSYKKTSYHVQQHDSNFMRKLKAALAEMTVEVVFSDGYGEIMPPQKRELSWFKRDKLDNQDI